MPQTWPAACRPCTCRPQRSEGSKPRSSWGDRAALATFVGAVVLLHWLPVLRYTRLGLYVTDITLVRRTRGVCGM